MIVFDFFNEVGERHRNIELHLVFGLVLAVAAFSVGRPVLDRGESLVADYLSNVVGDAVFVDELLLIEFAVFVLGAENKEYIRINDSLTLEDVAEILVRNVNIGEHVKVGTPARLSACLLAFGRLLCETAHILAFLKVERISESVTDYLNVHEFRSELSRTKTETVQTERILIRIRRSIVLSSGIKLTVDKLPVIALFDTVIIYRTASAEVLDLDAVVAVVGDDNLISVSRASLVDRVRYDLENGVLTAVKTVRAEYDRRTLAHLIGALEHGDAFVSVVVFLRHWIKLLSKNKQLL